MNLAKRKASLVLRDGAEFEGFVFGADVPSAGEVVFNTGMVGYPEAITDPSYYGQILVLTYPLIGNYGVPSGDHDEHGIPRHFESDRVQIRGLVTANYHGEYYHWNASRSLGDWLGAERVPGIYGVDTRALTRYLRERGTELGKIVIHGQPEPSWYDPTTENVVDLVSRKEPVSYGSGDVHIVVVDCGVKNNILRCLLKRGAKVTVVPWDASLDDYNHDGLLISNGPGDPEQSRGVAQRVERFLDDRRPMFGICLGCQVLAMAAGARTYKLPFGHRGQNQPVREIATGRWAITSQNHGYAVDADTIGNDWETWYVNGNDHTVEGLRLKAAPHRAVQFHPEAVCGPVDTGYLFDVFLEEVRRAKQ
ncbi:MAG: glutamine-hydrolyzing carbamoyl-phosphate synthase small subunit [Candidatus Krumholzibacteria bacterium]|nr:glutamine-hydrolyzing carbamoyl-phosphate synthase small subunit [Candidatus Krumholzibacteria bacterium]